MYFTKDFSKFFKELAANNHKDWFDDNRKRYHSSIKEPFEAFVSDVVIATQKIDKTIDVDPKKCIFRINKDIRFSKDKTPYKLDRSCIISKFGTKDKEYPGGYVRLSPEMCWIGGGAYYLQKDNLLFLREKIAKDPKAFDKLVNDKTFKSYFPEGIQGEKNKIIPKEFKPAAEKSEYIANKQFYYMAEQPTGLILNKNIVEVVTDHFKAAKKVNAYMREVFDS